MLFILTVIYAFNWMDRNVTSLLLQPIKLDLQLSDTQLGLLSGMAFAFFYSIVGMPIARWADRGNRVTIISISTAIWSAMLIFCAMAGNFVQLLLARVGAASGEAGCVPPAQSLIADLYERNERTRAMSIYMLGGPAGVIFSFAMAGWMSELYGWRSAFFVVGIPGIALALIARYYLVEPRLGASTQSETAVVPMGYLESMRTLWTIRVFRHLVLGFTLMYLFSAGISQWVPAFLMRTHHIGIGELGTWYALIWGVGGLVGTYAGGFFAEKFASNNHKRQLIAMAVLLTLFIPMYIGIYVAQSIAVVLVLMAIGAMLFCALFGPLYAIVQDVVPAHLRATAIAIILLFSNLVGLGLGPLAVGIFSDLMAPQYGENSLRMALLAWTPGYLWAAFHFLSAARLVRKGDEVAV